MSKIIYDKPGLRQIDLLPDFGLLCNPSGSSATGAACEAGGTPASCMAGGAATGGNPVSCSMGGTASCYTGAGAS